MTESVRVTASVLRGSLAIDQFTVSISTLLFPPLEQPKSDEFPLGVCTSTFTAPGPEMIPVVSTTFSFASLSTLVASGVPLIRTTEADTN